MPSGMTNCWRLLTTYIIKSLRTKCISPESNFAATSVGYVTLILAMIYTVVISRFFGLALRGSFLVLVLISLVAASSAYITA